MLKIGLTGSIGSGKTTVSKVFEVLGVPVFYADDAAKTAMVTDTILIEGIKAEFGNASYFDNGTLNRKHIANIVFNDSIRLAKLNALVHPATFRAFDDWVNTIDNVPYVLKEAALLFESNSYKMCDYSISITAPLEIRINRVTQRDSLTKAEIESREAKQFPEEKKAALADFTIINDDVQMVIPQVLQLHDKFLSLVPR